MDIALTIPEEIAKFLAPEGQVASRAVLELAGYDAFRRGRISEHQLQTLLKFETRFELWDFLKISQDEGSQDELETYQREFGNAVRSPLVEKAERSA